MPYSDARLGTWTQYDGSVSDPGNKLATKLSDAFLAALFILAVALAFDALGWRDNRLVQLERMISERLGFHRSPSTAPPSGPANSAG